VLNICKISKAWLKWSAICFMAFNDDCFQK
jgi:hypothetical protein